MRYYIIRYDNGYSDIIITSAVEKHFARAVDDAIKIEIKEDPDNDDGLTLTERIVIELRKKGFEADDRHDVPEYTA